MIVRFNAKFNFLFFLHGITLIPGALGETHWNVFLAAGQSNMVGSREDSTDLTDNAYDSTIPFYMVAGTDGLELATNGWESFGDIAGKWGPERAFARHLTSLGMDNVAMIKFAINGSGLHQDFRKDAVGGRELYPRMMATFSDALELLEDKGDTYTVHAMLWLQGTSDSQNSTRSSNYAENLVAFVGDIRSDLGEDSMPFITARHPPFWSDRSHAATVRNAQVQVALADPSIYVIDAEGAEHRGDRVHYSASGKELLGVRFAESYLNEGRDFFTFTMRNAGVDAIETVSGDFNSNGLPNIVEYFRGSLPETGAIRDLSIEPVSAGHFELKHAPGLNDLDFSAEVWYVPENNWVLIDGPVSTINGADEAISTWALPTHLQGDTVIVRFNLNLNTF